VGGGGVFFFGAMGSLGVAGGQGGLLGGWGVLGVGERECGGWVILGGLGGGSSLLSGVVFWEFFFFWLCWRERVLASGVFCLSFLCGTARWVLCHHGFGFFFLGFGRLGCGGWVGVVVFVRGDGGSEGGECVGGGGRLVFF